MAYQPKTISEHIECLARLTGAPASFVDQVRTLFSTKGISLHEDAAPYLKALDDAFRREESIRTSAGRARRNLTRIRASFDRIGRAYVQQADSRRRTSARVRHAQSGERGSLSEEVVIPGDHRTYVAPTAHETWPMVPGPEDPQ